MDAFFLAAVTGVGQRFCLLHTPAKGQPVLGGLVYIHPFAEEMNRSRRMAWLQANAFANAGYAVLQIDLYGCGDSSGEFGDASWEAWVCDVLRARQWLADHIQEPVWLWGVRAGCLLAAEVVRRGDALPSNLLFWQPVVSGSQHLHQFLRLKFAADLVQGQRGTGTTALTKQLTEGQAVEVAGYTLSPQLASGLEHAHLDDIPLASRVLCFELANAADAYLSPALVGQLSRWEKAGCVASGEVIQGPFFWQTVEVEYCPELILASVAAIAKGIP